ncbi:MFS transporter [Streptomyces albidoflavus]|uniref:MFS transporter n=1 Tax=Streptomyces albidoflavus TaxID=1886 RepID=UPI00332F3FC5
MTDTRMRQGRAALAFSFLVQGVAFALLVTRIPAIQDRYGISDALLPAFLAAVPVLAGVGSVVTERVVRRVAPSLVLRWAQPVVLLALLAVGVGQGMIQVALALAVFGLAVGALDASMNMLGFHAAYSLGGIAGASLAWLGAHGGWALGVSYAPVVGVLLPLALVGSRWYVDAAAGPAVEAGGKGNGRGVAFAVLLPFCLVMSFAYIGDSTVSNWSAKYLQDVLGSSEQTATVPYNVYMVMTLLGRTLGDLGVRRFGAAAVVRAGAVLAAAGFALVAGAPGVAAGMAGFTLLGLGLCVLVPQTFAAAGRIGFEKGGPAGSDAAVARLNVFNYVGFLVGSPLVGVIGDAWSYRGAMLVPMVLVLVTVGYARSFEGTGGRYGDGHERARAADVGRDGHRL